MKRLFNEYEARNKDGNKLGDDVATALDPIIEKWHGKGFSVRDIELIITSEVCAKCAEECLRKAVEKKHRGKPAQY